jgi:hypothetical protein
MSPGAAILFATIPNGRLWVAKDKVKKPGKKQAGGKQPKKSAAPRVKAAVRQAGKKAAVLAANPAVAEIVAATLVATAAAIKNPAEARRMAASVGDELQAASANVAGTGSALWQLALDIARRSVEAVTPQKTGKKAKAGKKKKNSK